MAAILADDIFNGILLNKTGLAPNRRQAITGTNDDPVRWRIYVALGWDELT